MSLTGHRAGSWHTGWARRSPSPCCGAASFQLPWPRHPLPFDLLILTERAVVAPGGAQGMAGMSHRAPEHGSAWQERLGTDQWSVSPPTKPW